MKKNTTIPITHLEVLFRQRIRTRGRLILIFGRLIFLNFIYWRNPGRSLPA